uniref:F-box domain-containing protein n=1 Tax=Tetradesmus obliquus TaxID=3088 RepID=A0A383VHK8_TETOB|eukprot:jgi/Sobl393_1/18557/SZX64232.1
MKKQRRAELVLEHQPVAKRRRRGKQSTATHAAPPAARLPCDLLAAVLQRLEQHQRLGPCSLVSRAWRDAAAAATSSLAAVVRGPATMRSLSSWLARHSSVQPALLSLAGLSTAPRQQISLPCSQLQLQQPQLEFLQLEGHRPSGHGKCAALSRLTCLRLDRATICSCRDCGGLCCLPSLTALQQLHLRSMSAHAISHIFTTGQQQQQQRGQQPGDTAVDAVPVLPQLAQLHLANVYYGEALPCLSSLRRLRQLTVGLSSSEGAANLAHLPRSLTCLEVTHAPATGFSSSCPLTSGFGQLTGLQHLRLSRVACVQPALLAGMVQLTHLELSVEHCGSEQLQQLLQVLPLMQQLQLLHVESWTGAAPAQQQAVASRQLTALLSSTQLCSLVLRDAGCLPAAAGQAMFPAGRALPSLRQLVISYSRRTAATAMDDADPEAAAAAAAAAASAAAAATFGADDVARLACCCAGLQELALAGVLQPGLAAAGMPALSALPGLRSVLLDGQPWQVDASSGRPGFAGRVGLLCV